VGAVKGAAGSVGGGAAAAGGGAAASSGAAAAGGRATDPLSDDGRIVVEATPLVEAEPTAAPAARRLLTVHVCVGVLCPCSVSAFRVRVRVSVPGVVTTCESVCEHL
jgi:hypothetical protein